MHDVLCQPATGCPPAPPLLRVAASQLVIARTGTAAQVRQLGPLELLPRPWLPRTCPPELLRDLLRWLDKVAGWLNHDYTWKITRPVPACWPEHPHILHELAVLAWLRLAAEDALDAGPIEDWHRYALPSFTSRLAERLGTNCATAHDPWPGTAGHAGYTDPDAAQARHAAFDRMVAQQETAWKSRAPSGPPEQLHLPVPGPTDSPE